MAVMDIADVTVLFQCVNELLVENGVFVIDGFYEECFGMKEIPDVIIVRARKVKDISLDPS